MPKEKSEEKKGAVSKKAYWVNPGCSVTCKKGVIGPGDEVKVDWVTGGEKSLDELVGTVLTNKNPNKKAK